MPTPAAEQSGARPVVHTDPVRPHLLAPQVEMVWRASLRLTAATVTALFPLLFILDGKTDWPLSPVLPGLAFLLLLVVALPFALCEALHRKVLRGRLSQQRLGRLAQTARFLRIAAIVWFLAWLALGA